MFILSIETSCDETAVSIVEANGDLKSQSFKILGNALFSQIDIHKKYGGVYPMVAKREHAKKLPILLKETLKQAELLSPPRATLGGLGKYENIWNGIEEILTRERDLFAGLKKEFENIEKPEIDVISVTSGPGLEPALWVGINCAIALGKLWGIPVVPANHMEGHIASVLLNNTEKFSIFNFQFSKKSTGMQFPALALLISGGHTELVEIKDWGQYKIIGETLDDAVGEAFDKTARLLGLPYPGGPEISKLAEKARTENIPHKAKFTRPMIHSDNLNFSFSGLKTAVLYYVKDYKKNIALNPDKTLSGSGDLPQEFVADVAREFEDTVVDVLLNKTEKALRDFGAKTLIIAGGVIANKKLRETFIMLEKKYQELKVKIPSQIMSTDNALMIACATYINILLYPELLTNTSKITANGNLRLGV